MGGSVVRALAGTRAGNGLAVWPVQAKPTKAMDPSSYLGLLRRQWVLAGFYFFGSLIELLGLTLHKKTSPSKLTWRSRKDGGRSRWEVTSVLPDGCAQPRPSPPQCLPGAGHQSPPIGGSCFPLRGSTTLVSCFEAEHGISLSPDQEFQGSPF